MLKRYIVRTAPVTHNPMLVDADSLHNGRLKAILDNKEVEIDETFYDNSGAVDLPEAVKIVQAYAENHNMPNTSFLVRQRLPKNTKKQHTNDANLQPGDGKPYQRRATDKKDETGKEDAKQDEQTLAQAAQQLHDSKTGKEPAQQTEQKEGGKATAENPQGATVHPIRTKRKYERKSKEQNKRSAAALKRYHEELQRSSQANDVHFEAAASAVAPEQKQEALTKLAAEIAEILLRAKDVL